MDRIITINIDEEIRKAEKKIPPLLREAKVYSWNDIKKMLEEIYMQDK